MRLGWIVLIIGLGITAMGGRLLYERHIAGTKRDIAYARLVTNMPSNGWYRVTGASWSLIDAVTLRGVTGRPLEDVYVRAHTAGTAGGGDAPAKLLVHIRDQKLADHMADIQARMVAEPYLLDDEKLAVEYPIEGILEDALTIDHTDQKGVRNALGERLADDYLVIAQGGKPEGSGRGIALLAVGIALLGLSALFLLRRRSRPADEQAED